MQNAINIGLATAVIALAAGLAVSVATRPAPSPGADEIRAVVEDVLAARPSAPAIVSADGAEIGPMIEDYLLANPRLLESMTAALEADLRSAETERARTALAAFEDEIYNDPANIVLGNPDGDVTLVELFDYNCGYCRQVVADVMALIEEDPDLRVILKEFPILSQGSVEAARIGVLVNRAGLQYQAFHTTLFSARGAVDGAAALAAAEALGLNRLTLELDMNSEPVTQTIQRTYGLAQGLGITGTPTFIIGDAVIPGAIPKAELSRLIANVRECGSSSCS